MCFLIHHSWDCGQGCSASMKCEMILMMTMIMILLRCWWQWWCDGEDDDVCDADDEDDVDYQDNAECVCVLRWWCGWWWICVCLCLTMTSFFIVCVPEAQVMFMCEYRWMLRVLYELPLFDATLVHKDMRFVQITFYWLMKFEKIKTQCKAWTKKIKDRFGNLCVRLSFNMLCVSESTDCVPVWLCGILHFTDNMFQFFNLLFSESMWIVHVRMSVNFLFTWKHGNG